MSNSRSKCRISNNQNNEFFPSSSLGLMLLLVAFNLSMYGRLAVTTNRTVLTKSWYNFLLTAANFIQGCRGCRLGACLEKNQRLISQSLHHHHHTTPHSVVFLFLFKRMLILLLIAWRNGTMCNTNEWMFPSSFLFLDFVNFKWQIMCV